MIKAVNGWLESEQETVSAREILLGCTLNEKKGFPVESAAKTRAALPPGFASGLRATEVASGGGLGMSELRGATGCGVLLR